MSVWRHNYFLPFFRRTNKNLVRGPQLSLANPSQIKQMQPFLFFGGYLPRACVPSGYPGAAGGRARGSVYCMRAIYIESIRGAHLLTESGLLLQRRPSAVQRASSASSGDAAAEDASPLDDGAASLYIRMIGECQSLDKHTHNTHTLTLTNTLGGLAGQPTGERHPPAHTSAALIFAWDASFGILVKGTLAFDLCPA